VLAATSIGATPTLLPWGLLADRIGERVVLATGLGASAAALVGAANAGSFLGLELFLVVSGAFGASVNAASGRAVMQWFARSERGLALGIRQANVPIGGLAAALVLPTLAASYGVRTALLALAGACGVAAVAGALLLREPPERPRGAVTRPLRDPATWRLSWGSGLLLVAQTATMSFTVLFLHSARGFTTGAAAGVLAGSQVLGGAFRIGAGHWSDRIGARIVPMRRLALAIAATLALVAVLAHAPGALLVPSLVVAGGVGLSWNGLSFTAAAELAGAAASGAAIGLQQTVLAVVGAIAPVAFAAVVDGVSWRVAFLAAAVSPLVGWALLGPLAERTTRREALYP
jgi:sugar phosphate permease